MPKKSVTARNNTQRNKAKVQKNFELVRPSAPVQETTAEMTVRDEAVEVRESVPAAPASADAALAAVPAPRPSQEGRREPRKARATTASAVTEEPASTSTADVPEVEEQHRGSAAARLAARRQAHKTQRSAPALITPEHYTYVRRDLLFIAILAAIMFATIIILHFVPGIGS